MEQGWIKLNRKLIEWEWYDNPNVFRLFIHCLLKANHKPKKWRGISIGKGSFITSRDKLAIELHLTTQQIRTALNKLKSTNEITIKTTNLNTLISIVKWNMYQDINQQDNKPTTNKQPTNNHQITTTKNVNKEKNDNNEKKIYKAFDHLLIFENEIEKLKQSGYSIEQIDNVLLSIQNYSKNKNYKSLYLTCVKWLKKEAPQNKFTPPKMVY